MHNVLSDLYEFDTGIGSVIFEPIAFCAWVNLLLLLVVIAINRYVAVARPVQVRDIEEGSKTIPFSIKRGFHRETH